MFSVRDGAGRSLGPATSSTPNSPPATDQVGSMTFMGIEVQPKDLHRLWIDGRQKHPWAVFLEEFESGSRAELGQHRRAPGIPMPMLLEARNKNSVLRACLDQIAPTS